jgi:casein kinase 1
MLGFTTSRKDDLVSLAYMMSFMINGKLPWALDPLKSYETQREEIGRMKLSPTARQDLCEGSAIVLKEFVDQIYDLTYSSLPDYELLRKILNQVLILGQQGCDDFFEMGEDEADQVPFNFYAEI